MIILMNNSLYVNVKIDYYKRIVIDIGTNYFISKTILAANKYYYRKIK